MLDLTQFAKQIVGRSGEPSAKEKKRSELRFASDVCSCLKVYWEINYELVTSYELVPFYMAIKSYDFVKTCEAITKCGLTKSYTLVEK